MSKKSLVFQAISWNIKQFYAYNDEGDYMGQETAIMCFGKTKDNKNVYLEIYDFYFTFYIDNNQKAETTLKMLKQNKDNMGQIIYGPVQKKKFYYFDGEQDHEFLCVKSKNYNLLNSIGYSIFNNYNIQTYNKSKDALTQFFHDKNIKPCGWIEIKNFCNISNNDSENSDNEDITFSTYNLSVNAINVKHIESDEIAKFKLLAYDIECLGHDDKFPLATNEKDEIVSIAATTSIIGEDKIIGKYVFLNGKKCPNIEGVKVFNCEDERQLLCIFCKVIQKVNPDFVTGWNNFGFDDNYIKVRAKLLGIEDKIKLSKILNEITPFRENVKMSSSAFGDNISNYYDMTGRINFDLMQVIHKNYVLNSYKLDSVASKFFREQVIKIENQKTDNLSILTIKNKTNIFNKNQYIFINRTENDTDYEYEEPKTHKKKFQIIDIKDNQIFTLKGFVDEELLKEKGTLNICNAKDDLPPKEIFATYRKGKPEDLKKLSLYNIQDCALCNKLCNKLFILLNNIAMSNTCYVVSDKIFNGGQGPRVYSVVSKKCKEMNFIISDFQKVEKTENDKNKFEGACVIAPNPGIKPAVFCLDYAALYPRSIICKNISHEMYINEFDGKPVDDTNIDQIRKKYPNYDFNRIVFSPVTEKKKPKTKTEIRKEQIEKNYTCGTFFDEEELEKKKKKNKICYIAKNKDPNKIGIIPAVCSEVLSSRSAVRKEQKKYEPHSFIWNVLEQKQLSYKVVCNSIYGALGAATGKIRLLDLGACVTATGQVMLNTARKFVEKTFPLLIEKALKDYKLFFNAINKLFKEASDNDLCPANKYYNKHLEFHSNALFMLNDGFTKKEELFKSIYNNIIDIFSKYNYKIHVEYGDTDSIFVAADLIDKTTNKIIYDLELRENYIKIGKLAESIINEILPYPENLEYEKILSPFIILSKKRYVGNLYENDPTKFYQKNMGLVLKRRDNAPIVKYIYGGLVDKLLNTKDQEKGQQEAIKFVTNSMNQMIEGKFNMKYFIISKTLKDNYKVPEQIAHYVLAQRIKERDPGNAPKANDRVDYVYIVTKNTKSKLQGDRIETPEYVVKKKIKLDYNFYITNQLKEPLEQIMSLFYDCKTMFNTFSKKCKLAQNGIIKNNFDDFF
jgi:DNA polymerase elongation subunit (family B)